MASNKQKIRTLEQDLQMATNMLNHMAGMIVPMTDGLKYIAGVTQKEEKSKIILLKGMGAPKRVEPEKVEAKVVATECLALVGELQKNFTRDGYGAKPKLSVVDGPEEVQLKDGDEIVFTTDFDVIYHECCRCSLLHSVGLLWEDKSTQDASGDWDFKPKLTTKWTQIKSLPTEAEITEAGHAVVRRRETE